MQRFLPLVTSLICLCFLASVVPHNVEAEGLSESSRYRYYFNARDITVDDSDVERIKREFRLVTHIVDYRTGRVTEEQETIPFDFGFEQGVKHEPYLINSNEKTKYAYRAHQNRFLLYFGVRNSTEDGEKLSESLYSYDYRTKELMKLNTSRSNGYRVFPDHKVYTFITEPDDYFNMYSLKDHKLIKRISMAEFTEPMPYWGGSDTSPSLTYGDFYFFSKTEKDIKGSAKFRLTTGGQVDRLKRIDFTYEDGEFTRKVGTALYKATRVNQYVSKDLITANGKRTKIHEYLFQYYKSNPFSSEIFSPRGKYLVSYKGRKGGGTVLEFYDTVSGKLAHKLNFEGGAMFSDAAVMWEYENEDIIYTGSGLSRGAINVKNGIEVERSFIGGPNALTTFDFDTGMLMVAEDPIPIKYEDRYMTYAGQGAFVSNKTTYVPVAELMKLIHGRISLGNEGTELSFNGKKMILNPDQAIVWNNRNYYSVQAIADGLGLTLKRKLIRTSSSTGFKYLEIQLSLQA